MDANTKNRFRIYKDEQEHKEMFYQKMRVREGDLNAIHIDNTGLASMAVGVALGAVNDSGVVSMRSRESINSELSLAGSKTLSEEEYSKLENTVKNAQNYRDLRKERDSLPREPKSEYIHKFHEITDKMDNEVALARKEIGWQNEDSKPFGIELSEEGKRKLVEAKRLEAKDAVDTFVKKTGVDIPQYSPARAELESMVYNGGPSTLGKGMEKAATEGDLRGMENEIRNRTNPHSENGINNRRGREANGFYNGIEPEYRDIKVAPRIKYSNPEVEKEYWMMEKTKTLPDSMDEEKLTDKREVSPSITDYYKPSPSPENKNIGDDKGNVLTPPNVDDDDPFSKIGRGLMSIFGK